LKNKRQKDVHAVQPRLARFMRRMPARREQGRFWIFFQKKESNLALE
jgi:hypothetical protein